MFSTYIRVSPNAPKDISMDMRTAVQTTSSTDEGIPTTFNMTYLASNWVYVTLAANISVDAVSYSIMLSFPNFNATATGPWSIFLDGLQWELSYTGFSTPYL